MKKVLYVLTENLSLGVIKSQVLAHIKLIEKKKIAKFEILLCYWSQNELLKTKAEIENKHLKIHFLKIFRPIFFLDSLNAYLLKVKIKKIGSFDYIHARTDYCVKILKMIDKKTKVLWDCRGDSAAELYHNPRERFIFLKRMILEKRFYDAGKIATKIIFVSMYLREKFKRQNKNFPKRNIFLIPSLASSDLFFFNKGIRQRMRKYLKIKNNARVFIYVGGMQNYQKFPQTLNFFNDLKKYDKNIILIVLTNNTIEAMNYIKDSDSIIIKNAKFEDVNNYLNASDFGLLIREDNRANNAGSPTKFAEYALTGLQIISSPSVSDYFNLKSKIKNIYDYKKFTLKRNLVYDRDKVANFYKLKLSRESFTKTFERLYE